MRVFRVASEVELQASGGFCLSLAARPAKVWPPSSALCHSSYQSWRLKLPEVCRNGLIESWGSPRQDRLLSVIFLRDWIRLQSRSAEAAFTQLSEQYVLEYWCGRNRDGRLFSATICSYLSRVSPQTANPSPHAPLLVFFVFFSFFFPG